MLLLGTDMASQATRKKFGLVSKFRIMDGGVGTYTFGGDDIRVAEIQEIIVGSKDLTFEEYLFCAFLIAPLLKGRSHYAQYIASCAIKS